VGQKTGPQTRDHNSFKSTDLLIFFTGRFLAKFAVKWKLNIPPHFAYVATLPCETLMSAKQAINDKLQGNVAALFKVWWGFNKIKKGLLLNLREKKNLKSVIIW